MISHPIYKTYTLSIEELGNIHNQSVPSLYLNLFPIGLNKRKEEIHKE